MSNPNFVLNFKTIQGLSKIFTADSSTREGKHCIFASDARQNISTKLSINHASEKTIMHTYQIYF